MRVRVCLCLFVCCVLITRMQVRMHARPNTNNRQPCASAPALLAPHSPALLAPRSPALLAPYSPALLAPYSPALLAPRSPRCDQRLWYGTAVCIEKQPCPAHALPFPPHLAERVVDDLCKEAPRRGGVDAAACDLDVIVGVLATGWNGEGR